MSDNKTVNIQALAEAMYKRECDYTGADHGGYCITENIKTLQSFEAEITRLTAQRDRATKKVLLIDEDVVRLTAIEVAARRLTSLERWQMSSEDWDDLDKALAAYKP